MTNTDILRSIFKNTDEKTFREASLRAQELAKNPQIRNAFSNSDLSKLSGAFANMSESDKQKLLQELSNPKNAELLNAVKNNIG